MNVENSTYQEWDWLKLKASLERKKFEIEQCYGVDYSTYNASIKNSDNSLIDYKKCEPKPTKYKSQYFRSKLEATWAAFFDKLFINWEYEPKDAKNLFLGWCPDFKIWVHQEPVYCEIKPLLLLSLPDLIREKIVNSELTKQGLKNQNTKLAILGNVVPVSIEGIFSLGYISLERRDNHRDWLPFSVNNSSIISEIWKDSKDIIELKEGLTHVSECLMNTFSTPVENFFKKIG